MLSQAVGYAATALGYVAATGGNPVLVKDIAEATGIPAPYLAKIVHQLGRKGFVITRRGVGGGVTLARPAAEISLYDLCVAMDDNAVKLKCILGVDGCSEERACPGHHFWSKHRARQIEFLQALNVADVAAFETKKRWSGVLKARQQQHAAAGIAHEHSPKPAP